MKNTALLLTILSMINFLLHAQDPRPKTIKPDGSIREGEYFNPKYSELKLVRFGVPAKIDMFNPSTSVWKWDTILCYDTVTGSNPFHRIIRTYNSMGLPLMQVNERKKDGFIWENYARETFTWDSAGNWLTHLQEEWQDNAWLNFMKQTFVYNSNGNMVDWKREMWQSTFWRKMWHYTWHYNLTGVYDTCTYQTGQDSIWVNCSLWIPSYDTNGFVTSGLTYTWANNSWAVSRLTTYTLDSMGNDLTELVQNWQNSTWVNNSLGIYTYDSTGHCLSATNQLWQNNSWVNMFNWAYMYDSAGNMLSYLSRSWSGNLWENSNLNHYIYDGVNNLLSITYQDWNGSSWKNTYKVEYTYDFYGNSLTGKSLKWYYGSWHPDVGSLSVFADHQKDGYVNLPNLYRYTAIVDSVLVFTEPVRSFFQVRLYPNPAHSMVNFSAPAGSDGPPGTLTMVDVRGRTVLTRPVASETTRLDISGLQPGIYFVRFGNPRATRVLKLVKD